MNLQIRKYIVFALPILVVMFNVFYVFSKPQQNDSLVVSAKKDTVVAVDTNTILVQPFKKEFTILDTLKNPTLLRKYFFINEQITGVKFNVIEKEFDRAVPGVKQIITKPIFTHGWKFWVLIFMLFFIGLIRLLNIKRFDNILASVYYLNFNETVWKEKGSNYLLTALELFVVFIATLSLFIVSYIEEKRLVFQTDFMQLFFYLAVGIAAVYCIKFILIFIISGLLRATKMAKMYLYNTIVINNILGIALIPTLLVYIYANGQVIQDFAAILSLLLIFGAVVFRIVKNLIMANTVSTYPNIYLIVYLCAFEIFPWLIIFKLLFKALQI